MLRLFEIASLIVVALVMGTSFAHVLEMPAKLQYDGELYLKIQNSLYAHWGPPSVGGVLEPAAILIVVVLAVLVWKDPVTFRRALGATALLLLAFPVVFFWRVEPANDFFRQALRSGVLPQEWTQWRTQWESGHAMRFGAHMVAFVILVVAVVNKSKGPKPVAVRT